MRLRAILRLGVIGVLGFLAMYGGGCATLVRGTHQSIHVESRPTGATIQVDNKTYTTPCDVILIRKQPHQVTVSKQGYRTIKFDLSPKWDGVSLIGAIILPGGELSLVADRVSGADMNFNTLAEVVMVPTTRPDEPPIVMLDYKGRLLTEEQYAQAMVYDRQDRSQFFRGEP